MVFDAGIVVIIAGSFAALAVLFSKLSNLLPSQNSNKKDAPYECGFAGESELSRVLVCACDKFPLIIMSIALEIIVTLLLFVCSFYINVGSCVDEFFTRSLVFVLLISVTIAYKTCFGK